MCMHKLIQTLNYTKKSIIESKLINSLNPKKNNEHLKKIAKKHC